MKRLPERDNRVKSRELTFEGKMVRNFQKGISESMKSNEFQKGE